MDIVIIRPDVYAVTFKPFVHHRSPVLHSSRCKVLVGLYSGLMEAGLKGVLSIECIGQYDPEQGAKEADDGSVHRNKLAAD